MNWLWFALVSAVVWYLLKRHAKRRDIVSPDLREHLALDSDFGLSNPNKCMAVFSDRGASTEQRLFCLSFLHSVYPEHWGTREAYATALQDSTPSVALYGVLLGSDGKLLVWWRLSLNASASAGLRLLALHELLAVTSPGSGPLMFRAMTGEVLFDAIHIPSLQDKCLAAMSDLVTLWYFPMREEIRELRRRLTFIAESGERDLGWLQNKGFAPPNKQARLEAHAYLVSEAIKRDGLLLLQEPPAPASNVRPLLGAPLSLLLQEANTNQRISTIECLEKIGQCAAEPTLLASLSDPHEDVVVAAISALATCGTGAAVKPLKVQLQQMGPLHKPSIKAAIQQIQARTPSSTQGGLSLVEELESGGELSLAPGHSEGQLSLTHSGEAQSVAGIDPKKES